MKVCQHGELIDEDLWTPHWELCGGCAQDLLDRMEATLSLPAKAQDRKHYPIVSGVLDYFPDAIAAVAHVSYVGNQQHNPGQPLHWSREKSSDHQDCIGRHLIQRGTIDSDGVRHTAKLAWRALALLQLEIEHAADNQGHGDPSERSAPSDHVES